MAEEIVQYWQMVGMRWSLSGFFFDFDFVVYYFEKDNQKKRNERRGPSDVKGDRSERVWEECVGMNRRQ